MAVTPSLESSPAPVLFRPFQRFFALESASSLLLLACTAVALAWANSPWAESYFQLWERRLTIGFDDLGLTYSLHYWINDGLMAVFFFVIGLEIKREVLAGELSSPRKAALPLFAAVGGMAVPASIYAWFNWGRPSLDGWGIPMATDIAFALGVLALLGKRAPLSLKLFLTALAIVDDLGAVLVIALFYTADVSVTALSLGGLFFGGMFVLNRSGVRHPLLYLALGLCLWVALLKSGVHATIAGVLGALAIPAQRRIDAPEFVGSARAYLDDFAAEVSPGRVDPTPSQKNALYALELTTGGVLSPLQRLEHLLHPWVAYLVVPLFAFSNAGVALGGDVVDALTGPLGLGIILGLLLGKQVGVVLFSWLAVRTGMAELPGDASWRQLYGVACLCGIGFTMSLFIANLAFADPAALDTAKTAILAGSLMAGACGWIVLARAAPAIVND